MEKLKILLNKYKKVITKLERVMTIEESDEEFLEVKRDSAIKRFEFCFDLFWKTLKHFLEYYHGVVCNSPKSCIREAFTNKLIEYDEYYLKICDYRNLTSHTYDEDIAIIVFQEIPKIIKYFKSFLLKVEKIIEN